MKVAVLSATELWPTYFSAMCIMLGSSYTHCYRALTFASARLPFVLLSLATETKQANYQLCECMLNVRQTPVSKFSLSSISKFMMYYFAIFCVKSCILISVCASILRFFVSNFVHFFALIQPMAAILQ